MTGTGVRSRPARYLTGVALVLWVVAAVLLTPLAGKTSQVQSSDAALVLPRSAESTQALIRQREAFPGADTPVAVVVYVRDSGITPQDSAAVEADRASFVGLARDGAVAAAMPSADGRALLLSFPIAGGGLEPPDVVKQVKQQLADDPAGLRTAVTGSPVRSFTCWQGTPTSP
jgi:RND superfamily putative drug exporter